MQNRPLKQLTWAKYITKLTFSLIPDLIVNTTLNSITPFEPLVCIDKLYTEIGNSTLKGNIAFIYGCVRRHEYTVLPSTSTGR